MHSPWRVKLCFCLCWLFDYSPLRVGGELEASEYAFLPLLVGATRHCELEANWRWVNMLSCLCLLLLLAIASWRRVNSSFCLFVLFSCFSSLLSVLSNFPAQLGKVRYIKRKRAIITYLSAFPLITCKTSNKSALNIYLNYYFLALINHNHSHVSFT